MIIPDYSITDEASPHAPEEQLASPTYAEYDSLASNSTGGSLRLTSKSIYAVRLMKKLSLVKDSANLVVYLPPEHLMDADFVVELKSLLPNCVLVADTHDPWREFLAKHHKSRIHGKSDPERPTP